MNSHLPPGQLTTSELAREIAALEVSVPDGHELADSRLRALYAERDERKLLAESRLTATGT